jgi:L-ascorbate metabolism protein UlaG (beta-lactamase superfamily)
MHGQIQDFSLRDIADRKLHHQNGGFINPFVSSDRYALWRMGQIVYWKLFTQNRYKSSYVDERIIPVEVDWVAATQPKGLCITWLKHAAFLINDQGRYIHVDPVFGGLFGLFKDFTPLGFDPAEIPKPHHVLITHGHYDHLDEKSLRIYETNTHVISPLGYNRIFKSLAMENRTQLDWFGTYCSDGCRITLLPCHHWTMRNPVVGPNRSLWGSFLIQTAKGPTVYIAGDTAFFENFAEIGNLYDIDLAIFNLGAYEPRWFMKNSHMNPEETLRAVELLGAKKFMIIHWGTFRLGDEPVFQPPEDLKKLLKRKKLMDRWIDIRHGQTIVP